MDSTLVLKANLKERHMLVLWKLLKRNQIGFVSFLFLAFYSWHNLNNQGPGTDRGAVMEIELFSRIRNFLEPNPVPMALIYSSITDSSLSAFLPRSKITRPWPQRFFVLNHPRTEAMTKRVALVFLILFLLFGNMKILKKPFPQLYKTRFRG